MPNLGGWHFLIILFIILLLFGAPKLPALARSLGESMKILKKEVRDDEKNDDKIGGNAGNNVGSEPHNREREPGQSRADEMSQPNAQSGQR